MTPGLWDKIRPAVTEAFRRAGIVTCELGYKCCRRDNFLSYAHAKKRRNVPDAEAAVVILACTPCHDVIEAMSHEKMEGIVMATIAKRAIQPSTSTHIDAGYDHRLELDGENAWVVHVRKDGEELTVFCKSLTFPSFIEGDRMLLVRPTGEALYRLTLRQEGDEEGELFFEAVRLNTPQLQEAA